MFREPIHFIQMVQGLIIEPSVVSVWPLLAASFLNDLFGVFPFALVLAGQLLFLKGTLTIALAAKLLGFVAVPVGIGSALGSLPIYCLSYFGGKPVINKFHRFLHFSWEDVEKINRRFKGVWYDDVIFLLLRCLPVLPASPLNIAAGILRMRILPFFVLTAVGSIIRMMLTLIAFAIGISGLSQL